MEPKREQERNSLKYLGRKRNDTANPSTGVVDTLSIRSFTTLTSSTRKYNTGKEITQRKTFRAVDTIGHLIAAIAMVASISYNIGGTWIMHKARMCRGRLKMIFCDSGFKRTFVEECQRYHVSVEVVKRIHTHQFEVLPRRWVVERTWSCLMNNQRLEIRYERDPQATEGFIWAIHSRMLIRQLAGSDIS